jgi:hypothetical protein
MKGKPFNSAGRVNTIAPASIRKRILAVISAVVFTKNLYLALFVHLLSCVALASFGCPSRSTTRRRNPKVKSIWQVRALKTGKVQINIWLFLRGAAWSSKPYNTRPAGEKVSAKDI